MAPSNHSYPVALFAPVVDTREVLESFLADQVLLPGWRETLAAAGAQIARLGRQTSDAELSDLGDDVTALSQIDLADALPRVQRVAAAVAGLLRALRVPGLPRPEDENWSF